MTGVTRFVSTYYLKKRNSISIAHEPYFLIQEAGFWKKYCNIPLYLHTPALLKARETPNDLKISMLSPSVALLSFRKTGERRHMNPSHIYCRNVN